MKFKKVGDNTYLEKADNKEKTIWGHDILDGRLIKKKMNAVNMKEEIVSYEYDTICLICGELGCMQAHRVIK